jgi:hypothetical protein
MTCAACAPPEPRLLGDLITELQEIERKTLVHEISANFDTPTTIAFSYVKYEAMLIKYDSNGALVYIPWPLSYDMIERNRVIAWLAAHNHNRSHFYDYTSIPDLFMVIARQAGIGERGQYHMRKQIERIAQLFWIGWRLRDPTKESEKKVVFAFSPELVQDTAFTPKQQQLLEAAHGLIGMHQLL